MSLLLEGEVDTRDQELEHLRGEVERLEDELQIARLAAKNAEKQASRAVSVLRQQLTPLYRGMQLLFGEMEKFPDEDAPIASTNSPAVTKVWDSWKSKLGGSVAKAIDALLTHKDLNTQQLAIATGLHRTTIPKIIYQMNQAGLINKNGGRFSLKQL